MPRNQRRPGLEPEAPINNHAVDTMRQNLPPVNDSTPIWQLTVGQFRELLRGPTTEGIAQAASPLGRCRHAAACKRRIAAGVPGAWCVGRNFYLSPEALSEELQTLSRRRVPTVKVEPSGVISELQRELGAVGK